MNWTEFVSVPHQARAVTLATSWALSLGVLVGCSGGPEPKPKLKTESQAEAPERPPQDRVVQAAQPATTAPAPKPEEPCTKVWVARDGQIAEGCRPQNAIAIDLSDNWTPGILGGKEGESRPAYRSTYISLANDSANHSSFGLMPAFSVVRERLANDARHACHDAIDDAVLDQSKRVIRGWKRLQAAQATEEKQLGILMAKKEEGRALNDWETKRLAEVQPNVAAIKAIKAHLRCEGAKLKDDAVMQYAVLDALKTFQLQNMLLPTRNVDPSVRRWLRLDSSHVAWRAALRVLRERVAESGGFLADGSAGNAWETVLGQQLEDDAMRFKLRDDPLPDALPDHISRATEAAAKALGWTTPKATLDGLAALPAETVWVELPFEWDPAAPAEVRAEIDRGDVWYEVPHHANGNRRHQPVKNLPMLTVFVKMGDRWRPAVRWPVTIGGWKREQKDGHIALRYEASPVGPVVWRDMVAAPVWLPPKGIPDEALISREEGEWVADRGDVGPGPKSAFGLAMLVHHRVHAGKDGEPPSYHDRGIRVHGTGNIASVVDGDRDSHGCHRTFPHFVLRMTNFLLHHYPHIRHGEVETSYRRELKDGGKQAELRIDSRGYRIELQPPIAIEVKPGRIMGDRKTPITRRIPLPSKS